MKQLSFAIENFGCQMNVADSSEINDSLIKSGYVSSELGFPDIVILNSCAVRGSAEERIYGRLRHYNQYKSKKTFILILIGCVAQKEKENILKKAPHVDLVIGTHQKSRLPQILLEYLNLKQNKSISPAFRIHDQLGNYQFSQSIHSTKYPFKADVIIIHGCDKYCSYCIVPYTRGREISRSSSDIISNVMNLVNQGVTEIMLLGQNVNSYGQDNSDINFADLLTQLNDINGLKRIRFMTSHPKDFSLELVEVIANCDKVCKYIHLPLQSASDTVLEKMKREYSYEDYLNIISELRKKIPQVVLSTDILVGFPYETEKDFEKTLLAMKEIRFDQAFMFKYSVRSETEASNYHDIVDETEKLRRLQLIINTQLQITKDINYKNLGQIEEIVLEKKSKNNPNELIGKTDGNKPVVIKADETEIGSYKNVRLKAMKGHTFIGEPVS